MTKFKLYAMLVLSALALAACGQTSNPSQTSPEVLEAQSGPKITIQHYQNGNWTGGFHVIDLELYNRIVDYILSKGGTPSPQNVDPVYHAMRG